MKEIERISYYEDILDRGEELINNIRRNIDKLNLMRAEIDELSKYYDSTERMHDIELDEEGKLPKDLKRGVLGEDYLDDFLDSYLAIKELINIL